MEEQEVTTINITVTTSAPSLTQNNLRQFMSSMLEYAESTDFIHEWKKHHMSKEDYEKNEKLELYI